MFSHVTVGCTDLHRTIRFFEPLLLPLRVLCRPVTPDGGPPAACWITPAHPLPRFCVYHSFDGKPMSAGNGTMGAFLAADPSAVDHSYAEALAHGGKDDGPPRPRPHYGEGYYGAYLRDPDGNKIHIVHRGDMEDQAWK
ncbi:VOC family protein [Sinorhizobium numidicum]|uniref:VOC family protein n=2 Tax=Sinorhizobium numidicum TaxID=680248 RepID=A0ABY8CSQ0_9HYPH|nr:VOC family protein [Sinorhizobium numidicum]WEX75670.1 VOC family protein [Sinorhizobium numidicum]WEX81665.1 VOC family protein [Sinorhizobium numidicum]